LVKVSKSWEAERSGFRAKITNTGLCLLEAGQSGQWASGGEHLPSIFVLDQGVSLARTGWSDDVYGVYRGLVQVRRGNTD
jgi:hypothetical protein